jgi:CrcB protein
VRPRLTPAYHRPAALVLVMIGGMIGATVRALTANALAVPSGHWPIPTFTVNLIGAFILGALLEALSAGHPDRPWALRLRLLFGTGFCGALTTYSTLAVEVDLLIRGDRPMLAFGYLLTSVTLGLLATTAGIWCGTRLGGSR